MASRAQELRSGNRPRRISWYRSPLGRATLIDLNRRSDLLGFLQDNVADFRLSTRTIILNPILRFLYWHVNFHIEHHMYAAVPCYRLGRLHKLIRQDLPPSPRGLIATWRGISVILRRQKADPGYQFHASLPVSAALPERG